MAVACPVCAASVDCNRTLEPIAQTLCAAPRLLTLDSQLSAAYTAALARDPSQASDLKRDELAWIGDRNRQMWWLLAARQKFPSLPGDVEKTLAHVYQLRIAFLRNTDNPAATVNLPVARKLLAAASALPANASDTWEALESTGAVVVPKPHDTDSGSVERVISTLAAPPDADLRKALKGFGDPYFTVVYLPSAGLGGAFTIEGTADCQYWVVFEKQGDVTTPVGGQVGELMGACTRDGGSTGYLALVDGHPVAINVTNSPAFPNTMDLQWKRWLGGSTWGPATRIRFRYEYTLKVDNKIFCPDAAPQCASTSAIALNAAKRFTRTRWTLPEVARLSTVEQTHFQQMLEQAPGRKAWEDCAYPAWFPAYINGKLVVGGISESQMGCHPGEGFLDVGFWGRRSDGKRWWSADDTIIAERGRLLFAARIPPSKRP